MMPSMQVSEKEALQLENDELYQRLEELQKQVDAVRKMPLPSLKIKPEYKYAKETRSGLINTINGLKRVILRLQQALQEKGDAKS